MKINWLDFEVKGQGHSETTSGQISTLWGVFSPVLGIHGRILINVTHHSQGHSVKGEGQAVTVMEILWTQ